MEVGGPVYQEYGEYEEYSEEELADPDFYVDRFYPRMEDDEEEMETGGGLAPFSVTEILEHCIEPTLTDGLKHMGKILAWCLVFRLATQTTKVVPWLGHAASVVSGTVLASHFFGGGVFYILGLVMMGYIMLAVSNSVRGLASAALVLGYNIVCETWLAEPMVWHMVRGAIMIVAMKIISLGFDMDAAEKIEKEHSEKENQEENVNMENLEEKRKNSKTVNIKNRGKKNGKKIVEEPVIKSEIKPAESDLTRMPGWFEFAGYCLCPGTVILGPWVSFTEYTNIFKEPRWNITWLVKILFTVMFAFMFLTISTCWNPWLIPDSGWKWWLAYRDAMSFRASHYFVSFMSEASAITAGFGAHVVGGQLLWHFTVTQPHNIEVPRSLVEVVVSWNLPMHRWLKQYVFKQTRSRFGPGPAVLMTYFASTLLHGLSGQLAAVLISLGFYTWVEHSLRDKLSHIMDASIGARREADSRRKHREGSAWVILVNLLFGLLAMFHLAYLGVMFDQSSPEQVTGYSWSHTLAKWKRLDYTSHWVVGVMAIINWLL
eukprot:GFUD01024999.1.p1 GENE.GFUD01024999.1~~GFUD01024999.1.p1  ORF type:complete len:544 (-),score=151.74 GFUD01024999.1:259-1890(-)